MEGEAIAGVPTEHSLARRPPARAGMATRPSDNLRLPQCFASTYELPLMNARVHHIVTGLPQSRCSHRAHKQVHVHRQNDNAGNKIPGVKELQSNLGGYNI